MSLTLAMLEAVTGEGNIQLSPVEVDALYPGAVEEIKNIFRSRENCPGDTYVNISAVAGFWLNLDSRLHCRLFSSTRRSRPVLYAWGNLHDTTSCHWYAV